MSLETKSRVTSVVNKYPTYRDDVINGCWKWLRGRRADDNAEGLWRIHDKLYDLKDFVEAHPGGSEWLTLTEGTDITEAFESYHIRNVANLVLPKYFVREASKPRNYKLTYEDDGFYRTLKRRAAEKLSTVDKSSTWKSKLLLDLNVVAVFATAIMTIRCEQLIYKVLFGLISAQCLAWLNTVSHNFIHQRNNFRMYAADLVFTGWREWRVYHGLSHHLYPNTITDFEISAAEPNLSWIPKEKTTFQIFWNYWTTPIVYAVLFHGALATRLFGYFLSKRQKFHLHELIPLTLPLAMFLFDDSSITFMSVAKIFLIWNLLMVGGSFLYSLIAYNAGHHGPTIIHEGDEIKSLDFGIFQLGATIERVESNSNVFMSLTHFGDHMLHHMFPSLDHVLLPELRETFLETCIEFKEELRKCSLLEGIIMQFQQFHRTETIKLS